jgi:uncharacterized protein (TIGR02246 family)
MKRQVYALLACAIPALVVAGWWLDTLRRSNALARDRAAVEELHRRDVAATLAGDPAALAQLWTDDAVRLEPGGPAEVGKQTIHARDEKQTAENPGTTILTYEPEIIDLQFAGERAVEWGYFNSSYKKTPDSPVLSFRGKLLRVLRRQPDDSWKFSHVMWNLVE